MAIENNSMRVASAAALHAHIDPFSGVAGDMLLAACVDASPDPSALLQYVTTCLRLGMPTIADEFELTSERVWRGGMGSIAATRVVVRSCWGDMAAPVPAKRQNEGEDKGEERDADKVDESGTEIDATLADAGHHHRHEHEHHHGHTSEHTNEESESAADKDASENDAKEELPIASQSSHDHSHSHSHGHSHSHSHGHSHSHSHGHSHSHSTDDSDLSADGPLRSLPDIRDLLEHSDPDHIPPRVAQLALSAFTVLAHAEASVHGAASSDAVHFHEVGAIDSIVDTIGTLLALHGLGVDLGSDDRPPAISCGSIPTGSGSVWTQHGQLPVPAFAAMKLLVGIPLCAGPGAKSNTITGELVTPTGAALVRVLMGVEGVAEATSSAASAVDNRWSFPNFTPRSIGVGAGTKDFDKFPNVLRIIIGDAVVPNGKRKQREATDIASTLQENESNVKPDITGASPALAEPEKTQSHTASSTKTSTPQGSMELKWLSDTVTHIICNIDDMSAEHLAHATDILLQNGALDAWVHPIMMKKGRSAQSLHCLCRSDESQEDSSVNCLLELIFRHTSTLGVRIERNVERATLRRKFINVLVDELGTSGEVAVKVGMLGEDGTSGEVAVKVGMLGEDVVSLKAEYGDCAKLSSAAAVSVQDVARKAEHLAKLKLTCTSGS